MLDPNLERSLITGTQKRPYGAKLVFDVLDSAHIGGLENVTLLLSTGAIAQIEPTHNAPWEGAKRFQIRLDGFATAAEAEAAGVRLANALLLTAVSLNIGLRLIYSGRLQATVYERDRPAGLTVRGYGVTGWSPQIVVDEIQATFDTPPLDKQLLLSLELCCSASLETNERSRFIGAVSALEPLASQQLLGGKVDSFVSEALDCLDKTEISPEIKKSLSSRVKQLRRESIRQSLFRLCHTWFPGDDGAKGQIDRAYALRSELLHSGAIAEQDVDLRVESDKVIGFLRKIYARITDLNFKFPTG